MKRWFQPDSLAVTGSVIGLISLALGWFTLKPNRLAAGTDIRIWESAGLFAGIIIVLWIICLVLTLLGQRQRQIVLLGISANMLVVIPFLLSGLFAGRWLSEQPAFARVSLGVGFWTSLLGAYILVFSFRQRFKGRSFWRQFISLSGLVIVIVFLASGWLNNLSVVTEYFNNQARFNQELANHIFISGISVLIGMVIGIPLGALALQRRLAEKPIFFLANITQTIPSMALFGLLIAPLAALSFAHPVLREWGIRGIGTTPAIIALVLYSLLPIIHNTYLGLGQIPVAVLDAGRGMGMSRPQLFQRVRVPLSLSMVLEGVRIAAVQAVGNTAVAALIGAGGLGWFIFQGLGQAAYDLVILGALPIIGIALMVDGMMRGVIRLATPRGMR